MERNDNICRQTDNQTDTNSKTEAHSYPLWIVGERANYLTSKTQNTKQTKNSKAVILTNTTVMIPDTAKLKHCQ